MTDLAQPSSARLPAVKFDPQGRRRVDLRAVIALALPLFINSSIQALLNLTDTWFIGRLSTDATAAGPLAYTAVAGERTTMRPGDFIITPSWTWHDHGNPGKEPVVWLDGLDVRIVQLFAIASGAELAYWRRDPKKIIDDVAVVSPTHLPSVPRVFEKIHTAATKAQKNRSLPCPNWCSSSAGRRPRRSDASRTS